MSTPRPKRPSFQTPPEGFSTSDKVSIALLLPALIGLAWFSWDIYQRAHQPPRPANERGVMDNVADLFRPQSTTTTPEVVVQKDKQPEPVMVNEVPEKPVVVEKPKPKIVAETDPEITLAPYPFNAPDLRDPQCLATLLADTKSRIKDGKWESHYDRLKYGLYPALTATLKSDGILRYDRLWESHYFAVGMTQANFVKRVTPKGLRNACSDPKVAAFLGELLANPESLERFVVNIKDEDDAEKALQVWADLVADDPKELKGKYVNLQIACALVFDHKLQWTRWASEEPFTANPLARYQYYRNNAERHVLADDITKLRPFELVWVVGGHVTIEEMNWALEQTKLRSLNDHNWSPSYGMIKYRMDFVTGEKTKLPMPKEGTLAEILEIGGICMHQAHFASNTAHAFGIPAAYVTGEGNRGGHAWFAYLSKEHDWNMNTGRYNDGYACGHTSDPQTGKTIGEFEVKLLGDPQRKTTRYDKCRRLMMAAEIYKGNTDADGQREALQLACESANHCLEAWRAYAECLEFFGEKIKVAEWKTVVADLRRAFAEYPDLRAYADELEEKHLFPSMTEEERYMSCRTAYHKLISEKKNRHGGYDQTRYDLIVKAVERETRVLKANPQKAGVQLASLYRESLEELASHLPSFRTLLEGYYQSVKGNPDNERLFLSEMERVFKRRLDGTGDVFRMKTVLDLLNVMEGYFEKCNDVERGKRLQKEADKIQKELDKLKKQ